MKRILTAALFAATLSAAGNAQADTTTFTKTGQMAPAFVCTTINGKTIDINKLHGKVIWLNFFATWCPPCNQELPVLQKDVWDKYKNKSLNPLSNATTKPGTTSNNRPKPRRTHPDA